MRDVDRTLGRAWAAGSLAALVLFAWLLTAGTGNLLQRQVFDDFYDAQARALLTGRWDVAPEVPQTEGFAVDGGVEIYFGPLPALARIPVLLVTDRFDGRLTTLSMLGAMAVLAVAGFHLHRAVRAAVRPDPGPGPGPGDRPVTRVEIIATGVLAFAMLTGIPLWLASQAITHHEAELWGLALGTAGLAALARWRRAPSLPRLAGVSALTTAAIATRQPFGVGLLAALALLAAGDVLGRHRLPRAPSWAYPGAAVAPALAAVLPNLARFGHPFRVPFERQIASQFPVWAEYRAANGGAYFRPAFIPTNLWQYLRPDALALRASFPWIDYRAGGPTTIGDVAMGPSLVSSSATVTMPVLTLLALAGAVHLGRSLRRRRDDAWLVALAAGAGTGGLFVLTLGSITHRYIGDLFPALAVLALVGFHALAHHLPAWPPAGRALTAGLGSSLVVAGTLTNTALALENQRERAFRVPDVWRAEWLRVRASAPGADPPLHLERDQPLPAEAADGTTVVVGDCEARYLRIDRAWVPVDRGEAAGAHDIDVDLDGLDRLAPGRRAPLLSLGGTTVGISRSGGATQVDLWAPDEGGWQPLARRVIRDRQVTIRVNGDHRVPSLPLDHLAEERYEVQLPEGVGGRGPLRPGEAAPGTPDVEPRYPGTVTPRPTGASPCPATTGRPAR